MKQLLQTLFFVVLVTQICFAQWVQTNLNQSTVNCFAVSGVNLFAGTDDGIFLSTDNGANWSAVNAGVTSTVVYALTVSDTILFAGTGSAGVFRSTNNGVLWMPANLGLPDTRVHCLAGNGTNLFAGTDSGVFRSTNNGTIWTVANANLHFPILCLLKNGGNLYAGGMGDDYLYSGIYVSTNNGSSWSGGSLEGSFSALIASDSNIYAGAFQVITSSSGGVFRSTDSGRNWARIDSGLFSKGGGISLAVSGTSLFVGRGVAINGNVFLTTNNGIRWDEVSTGLSANGVRSLAVLGTNLFVGTYNQGVWKRPLEEMIPVELTSFKASANGAEVILKWSTATELNNQGFEVQRKFGSNDFVTIGSIKGHGTTTSPNNYTYVDKLIDAGKYFYRLKQIDFGGKYEYSQEVEVNWSPFTTYKLEQNYPNPFNPTTTIGFGIPEKRNVRLSVLNILGEEIKVLLNEEKEAGYHSVDFNASDLPSGVYFYKLTAGNFISTRKMLLLK